MDTKAEPVYSEAEDFRQGCTCRCCDHGEGSDCGCECHASGACSYQPTALTGDGNQPPRHSAVDPVADRGQEGSTREGKTLSVTKALRSLPPVPMKEVLDELVQRWRDVAGEQDGADGSLWKMRHCVYHRCASELAAALRSLASTQGEQTKEDEQDSRVDR